MSRKKGSFESFMGGHTKTASQGSDKSSILAKLAEELEAMEAEAPAAEAPADTYQNVPADSSPTGANPAVVAATEAIAAPAIAAVGGNYEEADAGEAPAVVKGDVHGVVSDAAGHNTTTDTMHTESNPFEMLDEKTASDAMAMGQAIAISFQAELDKIAEEREYAESLNMLKTAGYLDGYDLVDDVETEKTAAPYVSALTKVANLETLTRGDIIFAASELMSKEASDSDALIKAAYDLGVEDGVDAGVDATIETVKQAEQEEDEDEAAEAAADAAKDPEVMKAVALLKKKGLL